jgi:hypothetical protein
MLQCQPRLICWPAQVPSLKLDPLALAALAAASLVSLPFVLWLRRREE